MTKTERETLNGRVVLVISHDFPPVRSPQSLRALAFVRRLARDAREVKVLTRFTLATLPNSLLPDNVQVIRASSGAFEDWLERRSSPRTPPSGEGISIVGPARLNWKGRTVARARRILDQCLFPDGRALWISPAIRSLEALCQHARPDVAMVMHEPAASLAVGRQLSSMGIPWLADLADPVLAPYTPRHWRRSARRLESAVVTEASAISVTNIGTASLLSERHGIPQASITLLPQGFDSQPTQKQEPCPDLRLVYTGRFYPFRDPSALLSAVRSTPGVRLLIAGPEMPAQVEAAANDRPDVIELLGELDHSSALALQASADVLVSVGNSGTAQTPGKLQEYFGACRPIVHLTHDAHDPAPELLARIRRGLACRAETAEVAGILTDLAARKAAGILDADFDLGHAAVREFHWDNISALLSERLANLSSERR